MPTVCVDFDGVIHSYSRGWHDGTIYDEPAPGALAALATLMDRYAVVIHTTRDPGPVGEWLARYGIDTVTEDPGCTFWNERGRALITTRKVPAIAYVDDRAVAHDGDWAATLRGVAALDPSTAKREQETRS